MRVARVIPCLDVTNGRVVKGINFVGLRDAGDPVELAARYDAEGVDELVFLDITASSDGRDTMVDVVYRTAEQVFIPLTVGGGIRAVDDARRMLRAGADKVSVNTAAVQRPDLISEIAAEFGSQCCVCAIDAKRTADGSGYLLVSSQGSNDFTVHERRPPHAYRGRFRLAAGPLIDAVTHTDGIEACASALGARFPHGLFVAQDDDNDGANQNFKLVPWERIAGAFAAPLKIAPPKPRGCRKRKRPRFSALLTRCLTLCSLNSNWQA